MACLAEVVARVRRMLEEQRLPHVMRVFSQGDPAEFRALDLPHDGLFLDADPLWSMREMIDADLLVTTRGTFGHVAGLLCEGVVLADGSFPASTGLADLRCPRRRFEEKTGSHPRSPRRCAPPAADSGSASARTSCTRAAPSRSRTGATRKGGRGARGSISGLSKRDAFAPRARNSRARLRRGSEPPVLAPPQWRTSPRQPIIEPAEAGRAITSCQRAPKNRRRQVAAFLRGHRNLARRCAR